MIPTIGLDQADSPFEDAFICRSDLKKGRTSGYSVYPAAELKRANRSGTRFSGKSFSELKGRNVASMIYIVRSIRDLDYEDRHDISVTSPAGQTT